MVDLDRRGGGELGTSKVVDESAYMLPMSLMASRGYPRSSSMGRSRGVVY